MSREWPDLYVQRMPFCECSPGTSDGVRQLAKIIIEHDIPNALHYIDGLELHILKILRIKPKVSDIGRDDKVVPIDIMHRREGIAVRWQITRQMECDVCDGFGTLRAEGRNGKTYHVDCPECYGASSIEDDAEFVTTDIDGELLAA